jgi:hypothetical protein
MWNIIITAFGVTLLALLPLIPGCAHRPIGYAPPLLPASYYQCTEITTHDLLWAYFWPMADAARSQGIVPGQQYIGLVFLFKNFPVTENMLKDADRGFIWVDTIKCPLVNIDDLNRFEDGDRVDVVGINLGPIHDMPGYHGLQFKDCYVLPTGVLKLPGNGAEGVRPGY